MIMPLNVFLFAIGAKIEMFVKISGEDWSQEDN